MTPVEIKCYGIEQIERAFFREKPMTSAQSPDQTPERIRLSYSKLSSYKRCPRAWKKVYLDGISSRPRPFFSFGTAVHEAFEHFFDPEGEKKPTLKHLLALWDTAFREHPEGYHDEEERRKYFRRGVEMLKEYYEKNLSGGRYQPAYSIEDYFEVPLGENAVMAGFIDRIDRLDDGSFEILDYKTEPTRRSQEEVDKDDQLTIYFWAGREVFNLEIKQLSLLMLNFNERMVTTRKPEDIPIIVGAIDVVAVEMKEKIRRHQEEHEPSEDECVYFPPKKNKYCRGCDHLDSCPLKPDVLMDDSIHSMEFD